MKKLLLASLFTLIGLGAVQAQEVTVTVENQRVLNNSFVFDVMLTNPDTDTLFLGYMDVVLDAILANSGITPASFSIAYIANSSQLTNRRNNSSPFFDAATIVPNTFSSGANNNRVVINLDFPTVGAQADFDSLVGAVLPSAKVRLGTFRLANLTVNAFTPNASFHTTGAGIKTKIYAAAKASPWNLTRISGAPLILTNGSSATEPDTAAASRPSNFQANVVSSTSVELTWTNAGSGYDGLLILVREMNSTANTAISGFGSDTTVANQLGYTAQTNLGAVDSNHKIGTTPYSVVFTGTGSSVTLTGLTPGEEYRYVLIPYNGTLGFNASFVNASKMAALFDQLTITRPSVLAAPLWVMDNIKLRNTTGINSNTELIIDWKVANYTSLSTIDTNFDANTDSILFVAIGAAGSYPDTVVINLNVPAYAPTVGKSYNHSSNNFANGDTLNNARVVGKVAVADSTGSLTITGLATDRRYRIIAIPMRGEQNIADAANYNQTDTARAQNTRFTTPAIITNPVNGTENIDTVTFVANQGGTDSLKFNWASPTNNDPSTGVTGVLIIARADNPTTWLPSNGVYYGAQANNNFNLADSLDNDGNKLVFAGSGNTLNVIGLDPNRRYYFTAISYGGRVADSNLAYVSDNTWPRHNRHTWMTVGVQAWLGGVYNGTNMADANLTIPSAHPYNNANFFNYAGSEQYDSTKVPNAVDWVLVEIRRVNTGQPIDSAKLSRVPNNAGAFERIGRRVALITETGAIVDTGGNANMLFEIREEGSYYVVVYHRNHLPIMSSSSVPVGQNVVASGTGQLTDGGKVVGTSTDNYVLISSAAALAPGNAVIANFVIDGDDRTAIWTNRNLVGVYQLEDVNLDNEIDAADRSIAWNNRDKDAAAIITTP